MANHYRVIGMMSGTSLDGIDIACVDFFYHHHTWNFKIIAAETKAYSPKWKSRLHKLTDVNALTYVQTDVDLGHKFAVLANLFMKKNQVKPMFIASHGHTIFHQPRANLTAQIGNGAAIAALTGIPTVCDFRSSDVAKGGQGAPLVPIGDQLLFKSYNYCLNLGGIANISFEKKAKRLAFDICPVNMAFNYLAGLSGKKYDKDGQMASKGIVNPVLFNQLNGLLYYKKTYPKSLGIEWFNEFFEPVLAKSDISPEDKQATVVAHICRQLGEVLKKEGASKKETLLVTGGGAFHRFLIAQLKLSLPVSLIIPDSKLINFKEAIIFAFLGVLRWRNEINTLKTVTGAYTNSSSGAIYNP